MHTDPIADMLTRIRNASKARNAEARMPHSKIRAEIARLLKEEGWIKDAVRDDAGTHPELVVTLLYAEDGTAKIQELRRVSKPGRRVYRASADLPIVLSGFGMSIVSTSRGLMTGRQARKEKVGGEVVCVVS